MDTIEIIYETPELKKLFPKFLKKNTSNNAPYHNLWHTLCMVGFCYEAADKEHVSGEEKTDLLIAALIHDFCHSEGKMDDEHNVKTAIKEGWEISKNTGIFKDHDDYDERVARIIRATQYPYVIPADQLDIQQAIIRDCDLFQTFEKTWFTHTILGLSAEMNIGLNLLLPGQIEFMKNSHFSTNWGKKYAEEHLGTYLGKVEKLIEILND